jgi:hypothetical protein
MDYKEIGTNTRNWVDSAQDSLYECDIELLGSINLGIS